MDAVVLVRDARRVSYSVYLENFRDEPVENPDAVRALLEPLVDATRHNIVVDGLPTEIYGLDGDPMTGFGFSRIQGERVWDVIYEVAFLAGCSVLPQDGPVCITDEGRRSALPAELVEQVGVRVITCGADIARVIAEI